LHSINYGSSYEKTFSNYRDFLIKLKPGVTELYIHAAEESDEIKAITNAWRNRDIDYKIFMSDEMKDLIDSLGVHLIGWRDLQELQVEQIGTKITAVKSLKFPVDFVLDQNYPNPFNSSTMIHYTIPDEMLVKLKIYNSVGSEVKTLVNKIQQAGSYAATWNGMDKMDYSVSSGFYIYELKANKYYKSGTMILLK